MNRKLLVGLFLCAALPVWATASSALTLLKGDFRAAEAIQRNGETLVSARLSESGKEKFHEWNKNAIGKSIHCEVGGVSTDFKLRDPVRGESLEMGPYAREEAA